MSSAELLPWGCLLVYAFESLFLCLSFFSPSLFCFLEGGLSLAIRTQFYQRNPIKELQILPSDLFGCLLLCFEIASLIADKSSRGVEGVVWTKIFETGGGERSKMEASTLDLYLLVLGWGLMLLGWNKLWNIIFCIYFVFNSKLFTFWLWRQVKIACKS